MPPTLFPRRVADRESPVFEYRDVGVPIAQTTRGSVTETRHTAHVIAVVDGAVVAALGSPGVVNPLRSVGKPFMAAAALRAGVEASDDGIAVFSSSHNGEPYHVGLLAETLRRNALDVGQLRLGRHQPMRAGVVLDPPAQDGLITEPLQNNCSGNHVAVMLLARRLGQNPSTYHDPAGAAMSEVVRYVRSLAADVGHTVTLVPDGCGIPTFAAELEAIGKLWGLLVGGASTELRRVRGAMLENPYAMGGQDRTVSAVIERGFLAKEGFDGLFVIGWNSDVGYCSVVVKVDSGSGFVAEELIATIADEFSAVGDVRVAKSRNRAIVDQAGSVVGRLEVDFDLLRREIISPLPARH